MENIKAGENRMVPDIRPENIETITESYTPSGGGEQTTTYKILNVHPIINGILDKLAFFRTHAAAVWYNKLAGRTVADEIEDLKEVSDISESNLIEWLIDLNVNAVSAYRIGNILNVFTSFTTNEDLINSKHICRFKSPYRAQKGSVVFSLRSNSTPYPEVGTLWLSSNGTGTFYGNLPASTRLYFQGYILFK